MNSPFRNTNSKIARAGIVLTIMLALTAATSLAAVEQGMRTGELETQVVEPLKKASSELARAVAEYEQAQKQESSRPEQQNRIENHSEARIEIDTNDATETVKNNGEVRVREVLISPPPYRTGTSGNNFEFDQRPSINTERLREESRRSLEEFRKQSEQNMEDFDREGQQGLEEFRRENQERLDALRQNNGEE